MLRLCVSVLLLVSGVSGEAREPDWGFQSYLDEDYTLSCNHTSLMPDPYNAVKWELPDGALMDRGTEKYMLSNGDTVINMHLTIKNVQEMDKGVYMCHVYQTYNMAQREYRGRLLRGLNIGGHKYRDPFDEYRYNLMVGGLAAVALFVPLVTVCFVYKFRFQTHEDKQRKYAQREEAFKHQRHLESNGPSNGGTELSGNVNVAYENEERNTKL